jgi:DNA-binding transcriptional ArsR family regulator
MSVRLQILRSRASGRADDRRPMTVAGADDVRHSPRSSGPPSTGSAIRTSRSTSPPSCRHRDVTTATSASRTPGTACPAPPKRVPRRRRDAAAGPSRARLAGDVSAVRELEVALPDWRKKERLALLEDPAETHDEIVGLARAWAELFRPIEDRVRSILVRDYDLRAGDRATLTGPDLIERTTGGVRWLPEPGVRRVVLAPSYFSRPFNFLLAGDDWRFFGYPVADDALEVVDPLAPPLQVLRLHRALGDDEAADPEARGAGPLPHRDRGALELSKPTIKHHLAQLRSAGLLTAVEAGRSSTTRPGATA